MACGSSPRLSGPIEFKLIAKQSIMMEVCEGANPLMSQVREQTEREVPQSSSGAHPQ